jgi:hypothetical protein
LSLETELWDDDWVRYEEYVMLRAGEREGRNNLNGETQLAQPYTSSVFHTENFSMQNCAGLSLSLEVKKYYLSRKVVPMRTRK